MDPIKLTNADVEFEFDGKPHKVRRANLQQVIQFQRRAKEMTGKEDAGADMALAAYAIFLVLNEADKNVTEEQVLEKCPGDIDAVDVFAQLGFMSRQKVAAMTAVRNALAQKETKL